MASSDVRVISYDGAAPGADSAVYLLFDSTVMADATGGRQQFLSYRRYLLSLRNGATGTVKAYAKQVPADPWQQVFEQALGAAATRNNDLSIPIGAHIDFKVEWTNGGSAQSPFYVAQGIDDGMVPFASSFVDPSGSSSGGSSVVTTPQLAATLGPKTKAQSPTFQLPSDAQVQGVLVPVNAAALTACTNELPLARYNASAPTLTDTQCAPLQSDVNGNLKIREQYAPGYEDNTNNVAATKQLPQAGAAYASSVYSTQGTAVATKVVKSGPGTLHSIDVRIPAAATAATYFLQFFDSATVPADGAVPSANMPAPIELVKAASVSTRYSADMGKYDIAFLNGLSFAVSSTEATKTASAVGVQATIFYK